MFDQKHKNHKVKCLVWDLDNTLWNGILLENDEVTLRKGVMDVILELDERGILLSIASRNDFHQAMSKLEMLGLKDYFIYPQINWNAKSASINMIADAINIDVNSIAFIDDQPFEREEVAFVHPDVMCIDAADMDQVLFMSEFMPLFITEDSKRRRHMYLADIQRNKVEDSFSGAQDEFLASLDMKLGISPAVEEDLNRAEELTVRTNQLNTTGYTYSHRELNCFRQSDTHHLWVASLEDKFGSSGNIGLTLIETCKDEWWIRLFLMSCRVVNRGVGTVFINHIRNQARLAGVRLFAEMISNDRNRMMYMTYKFNHFQVKEQSGDLIVFENDLTHKPEFPHYCKLELN